MESIDDTSPKNICKAGIEPVTYLLVLKLGSFRLVEFQRRKKINSFNSVQGPQVLNPLTMLAIQHA